MDKTSVDYSIQKDPWFSPKEILKRFELLRSVYGDNVNNYEFKKAREMFVGAITLLGAYELSSENKYFLQINTQSQSPDIMAAKQTEQFDGPILVELVQMEIKEFEKHSLDKDLVEFIERTTLSPKKSYDEKTLIVCIVNREVGINNREISAKLFKIRPPVKSTIYIIGRIGQTEDETFSIFSPYPRLTKIVLYDISETIKKYKIPSRIVFYLGANRKITYGKTVTTALNTYEILGLDKSKIYENYKNIARKFSK